MAITAWSAKVATSSICFSRERACWTREQTDDADDVALAQQRDAERSAKAHKLLRCSGGVVRRSASTSGT